MNQSLAEIAMRGGLSFGDSTTEQESKAAEVTKAFADCFGKVDEEVLSLKDEFSAKTIEFVVTRCRDLLGKFRGNRECWKQMAEFLDDELWKFSRLKEELAQSEKECGMVRLKLDEASAPNNGEVRQKRVMACAMLLAEKEMRHDHLQGRVSSIIDQFVMRILAGTQSAPGGDVLELRLRGVFGAL